MRIDEMQQRTRELRVAIADQVARFERETLCQVTRLEVKRRGIVIGANRAPAPDEHPDDLIDIAITVSLRPGGSGWITAGQEQP